MLKSSLAATDKGLRAAIPRLRQSLDQLVRSAFWIPIATAGVYVLALAYQLPRLLQNYYHWRPDFVWAPLLARDLASAGPGGIINVGDTPHYSTIWFLILTERLPFSRQIWDFAPFIITLGGLALMAWAARKVAGTWAGLMAPAIGVAAGTAILATTLTEGMRSHTWFAVAATSAYLVYLATRPAGGRSSTTIMVAAVPAGIFGSVALASDPLFAISGLAPLAGAATIGWLIFRNDRSRDLVLSAWITSILAVGLALAIEAMMQAAGYRKTLIPAYNFVTLDQFLAATKGLLLDILTLTNGNFFGRPVGRGSIAALGMAVLTVGAVALPVLLLAPRLKDRDALGAGRAPWLLYLLYWALVQLATAAAYLLSPIPSAVGQSLTTRYIVPVFYGIAATVPIWAVTSNWKRAVAAGGTTVLCLLSLVGIRDHLKEEQLPIQPQAAGITAFLEKEGLERGYASYRIAHTFTYNADLRQRAYPVFNCEFPSPELCPFSVNSRSVWYRPVEEERTFLIVDPPDFLSIVPPPTEVFGEPAKVRRFGELSVLIYDYDIASRFINPGE